MKNLTPESSVALLRGIGEVRLRALGHMGIKTLSDLVWHTPRAYQRRGAPILLKDGVLLDDTASYLLTVATQPTSVRMRGRLTMTKFRAFDESGHTDVVFFNQPYLKNQFKVGECYRFYGKLNVVSKKRLQLSSPAFDLFTPFTELPSIVPVYRTGKDITSKALIAAINQALPAVLPHISDPIPSEIREKHALLPLSEALAILHSPRDEASLSSAMRRTVFEEIFCFAIGLSLFREQDSSLPAPTFKDCSLEDLTRALPYRLTNAQTRALSDIAMDVDEKHNPSNRAMKRILIGDVGSGKTVVAAAAIYLACKNGHQAVLMAPTEILARQHMQDVAPLLSKFGIRTALLVGSMTKKQKEDVYAKLTSESDDGIDLLIGTHAVLNEKVTLPRLALTVTDEQHRFGVMQRAALRRKNRNSHLLVMSATPIPRTLALSLYGDLDISLIDELPAGRQTVDTFRIGERHRLRLYGFIREEIQKGGQAYVVCPSIEEEIEDIEAATLKNPLAISSERPPLKAAVEYARELQEEIFPDLRIAFMHGKMPASDRDAVMLAFARGEIDVLVSTTVIEVGVNVPNASVMIIENAERFGLSQLHQLRGRVGRGTRKSYCFLVSDFKGEHASLRLDTIKNEHDGFKIAEADLAQRGPGDFFAGSESDALRQSGAGIFRMASLCDDTELLSEAFEAARLLRERDPSLSLPEHAPLLTRINELFTVTEDTIS